MDIDDPDFWKKWAEKANVDLEAASSRESLILDKPRTRRPVQRVRIDELQESDSDSEFDQEEKEVKKTVSAQFEIIGLKTRILVLGFTTLNETIH